MLEKAGQQTVNFTSGKNNVFFFCCLNEKIMPVNDYFLKLKILEKSGTVTTVFEK